MGVYSKYTSSQTENCHHGEHVYSILAIEGIIEKEQPKYRGKEHPTRGLLPLGGLAPNDRGSQSSSPKKHAVGVSHSPVN